MPSRNKEPCIFSIKLVKGVYSSLMSSRTILTFAAGVAVGGLAVYALSNRSGLQLAVQQRAMVTIPQAELKNYPGLAKDDQLPDITYAAKKTFKIFPNESDFVVSGRMANVTYDISNDEDVLFDATLFGYQKGHIQNASLLIGDTVVSTVKREQMTVVPGNGLKFSFFDQPLWIGGLRANNIPISIRVSATVGTPIKNETNTMNVVLGSLDDNSNNKLRFDFTRLLVNKQGQRVLLVNKNGVISFVAVA